MSVALLSFLLLQASQPVPRPEPFTLAPGPTREQACPEQEGEDVVVCGRPYDENSPFRVPRQFRGQRSDDDRHASWEARWRDEQILGAFSGQTVGPSGYLQGRAGARLRVAGRTSDHAGPAAGLRTAASSGRGELTGSGTERPR